MHELGLLRSVVAAVDQAAQKAGATSVSAVGLRLGSLAGAVPEALTGSWPIATAGTPLAAARLEIEWLPASVWCAACQREQPVDEFFALACPICAAITPTLTQGKEFQVSWVDMELPARTADDPPNHGTSHSSSTS